MYSNISYKTGTHCASTTREAITITVSQSPSPLIPINLSASQDTIGQGEIVNPSALVDTANQQLVHWYDAPIGGTLLGTSASETPFPISVNSTQTFYAQSTGTNCGSDGRDSITISLGNPPNLILSQGTVSCFGTGVTLNASGGSTYNWQPGNLSGSSTTVDPNTTTTYTVILYS